ncbi:hypothetical protein AAUPMB_02119 [Pasteurella multocida subsp. multocida str. Anand1_buffalo]|nr:hypothetical protein AAUPMB_02119 [Pasteurella multocida subsp. multocida str. Anand1_buffalo]
MYQTLLLGYAIISIVIVFLILIQQGKGADAGASFGGGASGTILVLLGQVTFI